MGKSENYLFLETIVNGHSDFKVKCLTFGLYTQLSDSGPQGPLVANAVLTGYSFSTLYWF